MVQLLVFDADDTLYHWLTYYVPSFYAMAEEVSRLTNIPLSTLLPEYKAVHTALQNVEYPYATLKLPSVRKWYGKEDEQGIQQRQQHQPWAEYRCYQHRHSKYKQERGRSVYNLQRAGV